MHYFSITSLCPVLIWLVLMGFFLAICLAIQDGVARLQRLHQIPCSRCVFFTSNYHLKCTVHPCKALSEDAIACVDYEPSPVAQPVCWQLQKASGKRPMAIASFLSLISQLF